MFLLASAAAFAGGREYGLRAHDLNITIDTRWAGNMQGGYYPIRVRLVNTGPSCRLTFRFVPDGDGIPEVRRAGILADQNATLQFSLPVPMVGRGSSGRLEIDKDGELLRDFTQRISLAESFGRSHPQPSLLIVSPVGVDAGQFEAAVGALTAANGYGHVSLGGDYEQIAPGLLPRSWIEYSGVDLVAISLQTLASIGAEPRSALLAWVRCGGTLLVYNVGDRPEASPELARLVGAPGGAATSPSWQAADPAQRGRGVFPQPHGGNPSAHQNDLIELSPEDLLGLMSRGPEALIDRFGRAFEDHDQSGMSTASGWSPDATAFSYRDLMLGRIYAFQENPFPGTVIDWHWLLQSLGPQRFVWMNRHGSSARAPSHEFLHFSIPDLRSIPVYAFLILISVFTLVIGPVNYIWLWKRRQTWLLVLTIPALAFATSLTLFAYSTLSHGFSIKSRVRSLTVLDQSTNTAVATSRIALFAGIAPSGGLTFSPESAVYPVWPINQEFGTGVVDWSQAQALKSGWLHSRTRTQFVTVSHRDERGRVQIGRPTSESVEVSNGLEWDVESLVVAGPDGTLYAGTNIPAGATATLSRATPKQLQLMAEQLRRDLLEPPDDLADPQRIRRGPWLRGPETYSAHFADSWMEQQIQQWQQIATRDVLAPNTYLAMLAESPNIELGVESTESRGEYHLLLGYY